MITVPRGKWARVQPLGQAEDPMDLIVSYYIMDSAITIILTSFVVIERNNEFFYLEVKSFNGSFIINN